MHGTENKNVPVQMVKSQSPEASEVVDTSHQHDDHLWSDLVVARLPLFDVQWSNAKNVEELDKKHVPMMG